MSISVAAPARAAVRAGAAQQAAWLAERLRSARLSLLCGPAGCGKTWLLRRELLPLLQRRAADRHPGRSVAPQLVSLPERRRNGGEVLIWFDAWDRAPLQGLHQNIDAALEMTPATPFVRAPLAQRLFALHRDSARRFLFIFDGFENYLAASPEPEQAGALAEELIQVVNTPELPAHFLLSTRDEAAPMLYRFRAAIPDFDANRLHLPGPSGGAAPPRLGALPAGPEPIPWQVSLDAVIAKAAAAARSESGSEPSARRLLRSALPTVPPAIAEPRSLQRASSKGGARTVPRFAPISTSEAAPNALTRSPAAGALQARADAAPPSTASSAAAMATAIEQPSAAGASPRSAAGAAAHAASVDASVNAPVAVPVLAPQAALLTMPQAAPVATPQAAPATTPQAAPAAMPQAAPATTPQVAAVATPQAAPATTPQAGPVAMPQAAPATTPQVAPAATPQAAPATAPQAARVTPQAARVTPQAHSPVDPTASCAAPRSTAAPSARSRMLQTAARSNRVAALRPALYTLAALLLPALLLIVALGQGPLRKQGPAPAGVPPALPVSSAPNLAADLPAMEIALDEDAGVDPRIVGDLAQRVAPAAGLQLRVARLPGWAAALAELSKPARLAVARHDVLQAARSAMPASPLQIVAPLFVEPIYFVVPAASPLVYVHEIRDKRINIGPAQGSRALTAGTVYQRLFGSAMPASPATAVDEAAALARLLDERELDVMVLVGTPAAAGLSAMLPPGAPRVKLLRLDPDHPSSSRAFKAFLPSRVQPGSGVAAATGDLPTLAVMSFLVSGATSDGDGSGDRDGSELLSRLATALCRELPALKRDGDPAWRNVHPDQPLPAGWPYAPIAEQAFRGCAS